MNWLTIYYCWSRLSLKFFEDKSHVTTEVMSVVFYQSIQGMCCCGVILQHCHPCWQDLTMTLQALNITVCHFLLKSFACPSCGCTWHSSRYTLQIVDPKTIVEEFGFFTREVAMNSGGFQRCGGQEISKGWNETKVRSENESISVVSGWYFCSFSSTLQGTKISHLGKGKIIFKILQKCLRKRIY